MELAFVFLNVNVIDARLTTTHQSVFGELPQFVSIPPKPLALGVVVLAATPVALYLFVVAVALQAVRAKVEERKFLASVPEYAEFRRNTGFLWPKLH